MALQELLGMEEASLVDFVMSRLAERASPEALMGDVGAVLDEEAEAFCVKLYRMVIYETSKYKLQQSLG